MKDDRDEIAKELADVLIFAFHFATLYDIDISSEFKKKLAAAAKKYPTSIHKPGADDKSAYHQAKQKYRSK
jgi:NTP pyrophosphatase (non-canonical NTP hydrolase)